MVDTVCGRQMDGGKELIGGSLLKAVMGTVDKMLDRKRRLLVRGTNKVRLRARAHTWQAPTRR